MKDAGNTFNNVDNDILKFLFFVCVIMFFGIHLAGED